MQIPDVKTWKTAVLLSIIVPLSLLTSFKLTGLIAEPQTITETTTLKPVEWSFTRPSTYYAAFDKLLQVPFISDYASGNFNLIIFDFIGNISDIPSEVRMRTEINLTTTPSTFIHSINITFYTTQALSKVEFIGSDLKLQNLRLINLNLDYGYSSGVKAYMMVVGVNHPTNIFFSDIVIWMLFSPLSQTHQMNVTYEIIYYDGAVYKKILQPYILQMVESS